MDQKNLNEFSQEQIEDNKKRIKGFFEFNEKKKNQKDKELSQEKKEVDAKFEKERIDNEHKKAEEKNS